MTKTDNTKLINFVFFRQKLITDDLWRMVFPDKKKAMSALHLQLSGEGNFTTISAFGS